MEYLQSSDLKSDWLERLDQPTLITKFGKIRAIVIPLDFDQKIPSSEDISSDVIEKIRNWRKK